MANWWDVKICPQCKNDMEERCVETRVTDRGDIVWETFLECPKCDIQYDDADLYDMYQLEHDVDSYSEHLDSVRNEDNGG